MNDREANISGGRMHNNGHRLVVINLLFYIIVS